MKSSKVLQMSLSTTSRIRKNLPKRLTEDTKCFLIIKNLWDMYRLRTQYWHIPSFSKTWARRYLLQEMNKKNSENSITNSSIAMVAKDEKEGKHKNEKGLGWFVTALFVMGDIAGGGIVALPGAMIQMGRKLPQRFLLLVWTRSLHVPLNLQWRNEASTSFLAL